MSTGQYRIQICHHHFWPGGVVAPFVDTLCICCTDGHLGQRSTANTWLIIHVISIFKFEMV